MPTKKADAITKKTSEPSVADLVGGTPPAVEAPKPTPRSTTSKSIAKPSVKAPVARQISSRPAVTAPVNRQNPTRQPYNPTRRPVRQDRRIVARPVRQMSNNRPNFNNNNRVSIDSNWPSEEKTGMLEVNSDSNGVLRAGFIPSNDDVYISSSQIRRFNLRPGDLVTGLARKPKPNERFWGLLKVDKVNDEPFVEGKRRPDFDKLVPIYPNERLKLETDQTKLSTRVIDLASPIGKGQRGLIVSPPKAGKTSTLKDIATGIAANNPEVVLMAVLVGERPEEVTDIRKHVNGEVAASNFDESAERQTKVAELAIERAKRLVEQGKDVVILLDSITRLARAYNLAIPTSGRTLSGGFDPAALYPPKKFFGAARNFEPFQYNGKEVKGSLTILGTALVDTGSRMDELIYEEFKGTGNMELHLSRKLAERRVYPAIDIQKSGTRQEQLLFSKDDYDKIVTMRRMVDVLEEKEMTEVMLDRLGKTKTNSDFLKTLGK